MKWLAVFLTFWFAPAWADGISVPGVPQIGGDAAFSYPPSSGGGGGSATYTPTDAQAAVLNAIPLSVTINIGTAAPNRVVTVALFAENGGTTSLAAINGSAVTDLFSLTNIHFFSALVTSGTTATFTFSGTATTNSYSIAVGYVLTSTATPTDHQSQAWGFNASPATLSANLTVPSNGVGIAYGLGNYSGATPFPVTWSGTGGYTDVGSINETFQTGGNGSLVTAAKTTTAGAGNPTVTGSNGAFAFEGTGMLAVAFSP